MKHILQVREHIGGETMAEANRIANEIAAKLGIDPGAVEIEEGDCGYESGAYSGTYLIGQRDATEAEIASPPEWADRVDVCESREEIAQRISANMARVQELHLVMDRMQWAPEEIAHFQEQSADPAEPNRLPPLARDVLQEIGSRLFDELVERGVDPDLVASAVEKLAAESDAEVATARQSDAAIKVTKP